MIRALALAALVGCKARQGESPDPARKPPPDALRQYTEADLAIADYQTMDAAVAAGRGARDKLAIVTIARGEIRENDFTAYACGEHGPFSMFLTIPEHLRDRIRAVPKNARGACPRVLVRVRSIEPASSGGHRAADGTWVTEESESKIVMAETLAIFDVTPQPPTPPPTGVQFARIDDIVLSKFKGGEVAELALRAMAPSEYSTHVTMRTCEEDSEVVEFPDEKLDSALQHVTACHAIRFKLRPRGGPDLAGQRIEGELITIGGVAR